MTLLLKFTTSQIDIYPGYFCQFSIFIYNGKGRQAFMLTFLSLFLGFVLLFSFRWNCCIYYFATTLVLSDLMTASQCKEKIKKLGFI